MEEIAVVLYEPQDDINIGTEVRACGNFGVSDIRLVRPRVADPERILISAPNAKRAVQNLKRYDTLDEALEDRTQVLGATARARTAARVVADPIAAARMVSEHAGPVAYLFGREDHGLPNEALDRCDVQITIPTSPDYRSLNLAQAVLLLLWEAFRREHLDAEEAEGHVVLDTSFEPAPREQLEHMFDQIHSSLGTIEFYKYGDGEHVMRSVRSVLSRARLDAREMSIWFGIFKEVESFVARRLQRSENETS